MAKKSGNFYPKMTALCSVHKVCIYPMCQLETYDDQHSQRMRGRDV